MAQEGSLHTTSTEEKEVHTLENKVILEEIFSYCPATLESLKTLRLVCKSWKEACASRWTSLVPIVIIQKESKQQDYHEGDCSTTLETYLQDHKNEKSLRFPQRRMILEGWIIENNHFEPTQDDIITVPTRFHLIVQNMWQTIAGGIYFSIEKDHLTFEEEDALAIPTPFSTLNCDFWKSCYNNVTALELNGCTLPCHINLFPESFLRAFPNLSHLNLICCIIPSNDNIRQYGALLKNNVSKERTNVKLQFPLERNKHVLESHVRHSLRLPSHEKLTSLRVENMESRIALTILMIMFPKLQRFTMRKAPDCDCVIASIEDSTVTKTLKSLDIMQASSGTIKQYENEYFRGVAKLSLEELALECGLKLYFRHLQRALNSQSKTLKTLKLYRAPFAATYSNFPCNVGMSNLTELHLWGNMSENLNFLKFTPKLQVLKWNINCYDESDHGARIHDYMNLGKCEHLLFPFQILENTTRLSNEFKLDDMRSFEMSWGPITDEFWTLLGKWMPNLKELNGTVMNDIELKVVANQWHEMEHLELAHTSKVSAFGVLTVLLTRKLLQKLKSFTWKWCPCMKNIINTRVQSQEMFAENELRKLAGRNVTLPWGTVKQQEMEHGNGETCLQTFYEKVLTYESASTTEYLNKAKKIIKN